MAQPMLAASDFFSGLNLNFANPIGLGINVLLDTIVGGLVILLVVEILAKRSSEEVQPTHAFFLALVISLINLFGIVGFLSGFLVMLPLVSMLIIILPIIVWIVLVKAFFRDLSMLHVLIIAVAGYFLNIYLIPVLIGLVLGFIPM